MAKFSTIRWLALGAALALGAPSVHAQQDPIKIGELNFYARQAAFTVPYRNGIALAVEQILLVLAPGLGLTELRALGIEHALELGEISPEWIELGRELGGSGVELPNLDVSLLELE